MRFESPARQIRNTGKHERREGCGRHDHTGHFEIEAVRTQEKQAYQRCVHSVVPDQGRQDSPPQHHDSRDDPDQADLDATDVRRLLRIVAVQKAPEKCRNNHGEPARFRKFGEKGNGKEAKREFFVGGGQQPYRRARDPREERVHGLLVIHFLRGPRTQPGCHDVESDHVSNVRCSQRQAHHGRREKLFRTQSAQREGLG